MKIYEKEIINTIVSDLKDLQKTMNKNELVRFLDYTIIMRNKLGHSNEFMEKLYFIRYYYNIGGVFND